MAEASGSGGRASDQLSNDKAVDLQEEDPKLRTAGGHHRIPQSEIDRLVISDKSENWARKSDRYPPTERQKSAW